MAVFMPFFTVELSKQGAVLLQFKLLLSFSFSVSHVFTESR